MKKYCGKLYQMWKMVAKNESELNSFGMDSQLVTNIQVAPTLCLSV